MQENSTQPVNGNNPVAAEAQKEVERQLHTMLLGRHQAYRSGGVSAIAPYLRDDGPYYFGEELARQIKAGQFFKKFYPRFYQVLLDYPKIGSAEIQEQYFWVKLISQNPPTFVLAHRISFSDGVSYAMVSRQFYASQSYNGQQELAVFLPVEQHTLVFYLN